MTRAERTNHRSLAFSKWIRANLPDSETGFLVFDVDFVLVDKAHKKVMLLEEKTHNATVSPAQQEFMELMDSWLRKGVNNGWKYEGYYTVVFENTSPADGRIIFDGIEVNEDILIDILSLGRWRYRNPRRYWAAEVSE